MLIDCKENKGYYELTYFFYSNSGWNFKYEQNPKVKFAKI